MHAIGPVRLIPRQLMRWNRAKQPLASPLILLAMARYAAKAILSDVSKTNSSESHENTSFFDCPSGTYPVLLYPGSSPGGKRYVEHQGSYAGSWGE